MAETPKKIIECHNNCFLCNVFTPSSAERVKIFGKSVVDLARLIDLTVGESITSYGSSGADLFVCTKCYKRLIRFKKAKQNAEEIKEEICTIYQSMKRRIKRQRADQDVENITHIHEQITTAKRIPAAKSLNFSHISENISLSSTPTSSNAVGNVATTCTSYSRPAVCFGNSFVWTSPRYLGEELVKQAFSAPLMSSTPVATKKSSTQNHPTETTTVKLSVNYPSKTVNRTLPQEYEALGKALIHGPPSRIATAVLKCAPVSPLLIEKVLRILKTEVGDLCSRKNPSLLRKCAKDDLVNFDFEKVCNEWKQRAPTFYSFLLTACTGQHQHQITWLPSMAIAGSILLKQRHPQMNATASIMSLLLKTKSTEVSII